MNELDIVLSTVEDLHKRYSMSWDKVPVAELALVLERRKDYRYEMAHGNPACRGRYFISLPEERDKLNTAAAMVGLEVVWEGPSVADIREVPK